MRLVLALGLAVTACGTDSPQLTLGLAIQPSVVAFRADGGRWFELPQIAHSAAATTYELPNEDGVLAVACVAADGTFDVEELFATAAELPAILYAPFAAWPQLACRPSPPDDQLVEVSGNVMQGGSVQVGDATFFGADDWTFHGGVPAGTHDLVALGQSTVMIRHDQPMNRPYQESDIDLASGSAIGSIPLVDSTGEPVQGELVTELETVNGTDVMLQSATSSAFVVPPAQLEQGDVETVTLYPGAGFIATVLVSSGVAPPIPYVVAPPNPTFGSDAISADWGADAPGAFTTMRVAYITQDGVLAASESAGWANAHDTSEVVFDETVPEFRWPIQPTASEHLFVQSLREGPLLVQASVSSP